ncbi:MAG: type transport system permease protein [Actinomycetota bacterium]|jgi:ABC-2 type transport system permease protein|nr:type transport system permease protein [Actinomycetota bacterium]
MNTTWLLTRRALRETIRTPESTLPTLAIPLFFLAVNVGQASRVFPSGTTSFLHGQGYAAFQLPSSLLLAASFGSAAQYLVEDIEGGYFDKLRATPIPRTAIVLGRLLAGTATAMVIATLMVLVSLPFGIRVASGIGGFVVLIALMAAWTLVFSGFMQLIALKSRSAAATQSGSIVFFPLLFLTPGFVPRHLLTRPMEIAASCNPVTYIMEAMRSLILQGFVAGPLLRGFAILGVLLALVLFLNVRMIRNYD